MDSIPVSEKRKAQLEALARQQGQDLATTAEDVLVLGLERHEGLDQEAREIREMLDARFDSAVQDASLLLSPEEARRQLSERHDAYLRRR